MRELTIAEISDVSGGGFFGFIADRVVGAAVGAAMGASSGMGLGGVQTGNGGGIFGFGIIAEGVGAIAGTTLGTVAGAVIGGAFGFQEMKPIVANWIDHVGNGDITGPRGGLFH